MLRRIAAAAAAALFSVSGYAENPPTTATKPEVAQQIFACLAPGLPKDWRKVWVVVKELKGTDSERRFEADFRYATSSKDDKGAPLRGLGCEQGDFGKKILDLNEYLEPNKRNWSAATVTYTTDGKGNIGFNVRYEYPTPPEKGK